MLTYAEAKSKAEAASEFCAEQFQRLAEPVAALQAENAFYIEEEFDSSALRSACCDAADETALRAALRRWRNLHMLRIAVSDIADQAETATVLKALSLLADTAVQLALDWETARLAEKYGSAEDENGAQQQLFVLGMGKLGGYELNFSSDIDLIFLYPKPGKTTGPRVLSNQEFYTKLAQKVSGHLSAITADGFVFRVDTRLRPYGDSGPLVMHSQQALEYYEKHGREWERYAMIKARVCAGDQSAGAEFLAALQPFVYRRYIDFTAVNGLRQMKRMIEAQYSTEDLKQNVKLGPGGIREVEFVAQLFQLMRGGRHGALRSAELVPVLEALGELELLPTEQAASLQADYYLLRRFENRLQQYRDQQTHQLPEKSNVEDWQRLAASLNYADANECQQKLSKAQQRVHQAFGELFAESEAVDSNQAEEPQECDYSPALLTERLQNAGYQDESLARRFAALASGRAAKGFSEENRQQLFTLLEALFGECQVLESRDRALSRVLEVVEGIGQRAAYIALLAEYPDARKQLLALCDASPWVTHQLARYPLLLDELLDPRVLEGISNRQALLEDLSARLAELADDDLEQQMEALRQFKNAAVLRVAAADINHHMPLMKVSDCLTELAEVILNKAVELASAEMMRRYGRPKYYADGKEREAELLVVAYGKLGGIELGYGSDLDVVFLHTSEGDKQFTDGANSQPNGVFFSRVVQRVLHILQTITPSGRLYEIDTRLRPNGASGLPVVGLEAYDHYLQESAWTWELQALVRARLVVGSEGGLNVFKVIRQRHLSIPRDVKKLAQDVWDMRDKMVTHLNDAKDGQFNLKYGSGGLVDIEFLLQFLVLAYAHVAPDKWTRFSDNVRLIQAAEEHNVLQKAQAKILTDAYISLRRRSHALALQEQSKNMVSQPEKAVLASKIVRQFVAALDTGFGAGV